MFQEFLSKLDGITRVIDCVCSLFKQKQKKTKQNKNYQLCQMHGRKSGGGGGTGGHVPPPPRF